MFCHLSTYELTTIIDKGEESAVAVHPVYTMLDERVEREVAARDWIGR